MSKLTGKTAVITGASRGIGHGIALAFAREGASVVINYRNSMDKAERLLTDINDQGGKAIAIQADISQQDEINQLIKQVLSDSGRIDIWVNNAGADILTGSGAQLNDQEKLQQLIEVDLKGTIACCWAVAPVMKKQGKGAIINMSWDLAIHGFQGRNPEIFAAAKAGVLAFSRSFAKNQGPEIRVNILAPGWIQTGFAEEVMPRDYYEARLREIPLGRFGTPGDVAEVAVFLASDDASYITGEMIKINGGLS